MSLAEKQARAAQMRSELSALRSSREHALQDAHDVAAEDQMDQELASLEREREAERAVLDQATGSGSASAAIAAMHEYTAVEVESADAKKDSESDTTEKQVEKPVVVESAAPASSIMNLPVQGAGEGK